MSARKSTPQEAMSQLVLTVLRITRTPDITVVDFVTEAVKRKEPK